MKAFNLLIKYRFWLGVAALIGAVAVNITSGFWPSLALYLVAVILIVTHFFIGPLRRRTQQWGDGSVFAASTGAAPEARDRLLADLLEVVRAR